MRAQLASCGNPSSCTWPKPDLLQERDGPVRNRWHHSPFSRNLACAPTCIFCGAAGNDIFLRPAPSLSLHVFLDQSECLLMAKVFVEASFFRRSCNCSKCSGNLLLLLICEPPHHDAVSVNCNTGGILGAIQRGICGARCITFRLLSVIAAP